jgi:hypothetical protein
MALSKHNAPIVLDNQYFIVWCLSKIPFRWNFYNTSIAIRKKIVFFAGMTTRQYIINSSHFASVDEGKRALRTFKRENRAMEDPEHPRAFFDNYFGKMESSRDLLQYFIELKDFLIERVADKVFVRQLVYFAYSTLHGVLQFPNRHCFLWDIYKTRDNVHTLVEQGEWLRISFNANRDPSSSREFMDYMLTEHVGTTDLTTIPPTFIRGEEIRFLGYCPQNSTSHEWEPHPFVAAQLWILLAPHIGEVGDTTGYVWKALLLRLFQANECETYDKMERVCGVFQHHTEGRPSFYFRKVITIFDADGTTEEDDDSSSSIEEPSLPDYGPDIGVFAPEDPWFLNLSSDEKEEDASSIEEEDDFSSIEEEEDHSSIEEEEDPSSENSYDPPTDARGYARELIERVREDDNFAARMARRLAEDPELEGMTPEILVRIMTTAAFASAIDDDTNSDVETDD